MDDALILGIETSCDETAAAVVRSGEQMLSSVVYSQISTHQVYGGVVPELASREHLRAIVPVVRKAVGDAGLSLPEVDAIAVTQGPGLAGALLVGITYAKALAFALEKPLIAVNHLEGHIHAVLLEEKQRGGEELPAPVLALVVSGGHTHLYTAERKQSTWQYRNIGRTRDDAAGEAFDKVAKLLGFGYPGGPILDELAKHGDPRAVRFGSSQIKGDHRGRAPEDQTDFDFSFSGLKTAVLRHVQTHGLQDSIEQRRKALMSVPHAKSEDCLAQADKQTLDLVASFQRAVVQDLVHKTLRAAEAMTARSLLITGGVAANSELRETFQQEATEAGLPVYFPSRALATDNAAMIAAAAFPKFVNGDFAVPEFSAEASLALG